MAGKGRLVSGEIMTTAPAGDAKSRRGHGLDVLDAEFETLAPPG